MPLKSITKEEITKKKKILIRLKKLNKIKSKIKPKKKKISKTKTQIK